jgi:hypothetical protein
MESDYNHKLRLELSALIKMSLEAVGEVMTVVSPSVPEARDTEKSGIETAFLW